MWTDVTDWILREHTLEHLWWQNRKHNNINWMRNRNTQQDKGGRVQRMNESPLIERKGCQNWPLTNRSRCYVMPVLKKKAPKRQNIEGKRSNSHTKWPHFVKNYSSTCCMCKNTHGSWSRSSKKRLENDNYKVQPDVRHLQAWEILRNGIFIHLFF